VNPILLVFRKEVLDGFRDRRSLLSLLLFPLVGPALAALMLTVSADRLASGDATALPVVGRDNAPELVAFLEGHGVELQPPPADVEAAVRDRDVFLVLVIPDDYPARFRSGRPATVELIVDQSRAEALGSVRRVRELVEAYATSVGMLRLLARGVNPELALPVKVQEVDLSTPQKRAAIFLNLIPMFVLLGAFIGGMYTATDSTAGERERGSLEPLLITPISRRSLVLGKWLATVLFSTCTVLLTFVFAVAALSQVPMASFGISLSLGPTEVVGVLLAVLPLPFCVAGVQMMVASFARSFKEAQTYLSLMSFIPMLPALMLMLDPGKGELWMTPIPVFGQQVLLSEVLRGEAIPFASFGLAAISAIACGLICVYLTAALFRRERIIYGR